MSLFKTENVKVFPSAFRTKPGPSNGKYTSEENFVNIINSIVDYPNRRAKDTSNKVIHNDGYIVSTDNNKLTVVIHGYLFTIDTGVNFGNFDSFNNSQTIWLYIRVEDGAIESASNALVNSDNESITLDTSTNFTGISYIIYTPSSSSGEFDPPQIAEKDRTTVYTLQIVKKNKKYCDENRLKFNSKYISYEDSTGIQSTENVLKRVDSNLDEIEENISILNGDKPFIENRPYRKKQDQLVKPSDGYLNITNNNDRTSTISISGTAKTTLDTIKSKGGSGLKLIFIDANGKVQDSEQDVGCKNKPVENTQNKVTQSQNVYLNKGTVTGGYTVFVSTDAPTEATYKNVGQEGDFWFKYNN